MGVSDSMSDLDKDAVSTNNGPLDVENLLKTRFKKLYNKIHQGTQQAFSNKTGIPQETVSRLFRGETLVGTNYIYTLIKIYGQIVVDTLFGEELGNVSETNILVPLSDKEKTQTQLVWTTRSPYFMDEAVKNDCKEGVKFFENIVKHKFSVQTAIEQSAYKGKPQASDLLNHALILAFQSKALELLKVPRDTHLENLLLERFGNQLKDVRVAAIPRNKEDQYHQSTLIRSEYVAWLAATSVLSQLPQVKYVGIGGGYTVRRMAELSYSRVNQFIPTVWTPLSTYKEKFDSETIEDNDVNFTAQLLMTRHPGSRAVYYLFRDGADEKPVDPIIRPKHESLSVAFVSINARRNNSNLSSQEGLDGDYQTANNKGITNIRQIYALVPPDKAAGEFLGKLLDDDGNSIEEVKDILKQYVQQINFDVLRNRINQDAQVWLLGAGLYKVRPIRMAIRSSLANCLVIDSEIAEALIRDGI
jgi:DNA-binding transcriptional regulator LsrR (DeoR family)